MIIHNDCTKAMAEMVANSVDAIVCDPPYGLEFMGKEWDKLDKPGRDRSKAIQASSFGKIMNSDCETPRISRSQRRKCSICGGYSGGPFQLCSCDSPKWIPSSYPVAMQPWHAQWLKEAYRVLKPGGSMLVMGGTRTFHRLMVAIEDSGFIIKDVLMWLYGSGLPKAQDLGKMIDKRNGRTQRQCLELGQYLKKMRGDIPQKNIAKFFPSKTGGLTGCVANWELGLNVPTKSQWAILKRELLLDNKFDKLIEREEAAREKIGNGTSGKTAIWNEKGNMGKFDITAPSTDLAKHWDGWKVGGIKPAYEPIVWAVKPPEGSYIDNILKWGTGGVNVDECRVGYESNAEYEMVKNRSGGEKGFSKTYVGQDDGNFLQKGTLTVDSKGRFPANIILDEEAGRLLDEQSGVLKARGNTSPTKRNQSNGITGWGIRAAGQVDPSDSGGASRFFYCAKASRSERNAGCEGLAKIKNKRTMSGGADTRGRPTPINNNTHPTVKPIALFKYLIKLVARKGQTVLDPFMGSGTTGCACAEVEREFIGIEKDAEYIEIARKRIDHWENIEKQKELFT